VPYSHAHSCSGADAQTSTLRRFQLFHIYPLVAAGPVAGRFAAAGSTPSFAAAAAVGAIPGLPPSPASALHTSNLTELFLLRHANAKAVEN
jgi:hypothetical protein